MKKIPAHRNPLEGRRTTRRHFLRVCAGLGTGIAMRPALASIPRKKERFLSFYNIHTTEQLRSVYWSEGRYRVDSLTKINHLLRDHRTGDIHPIDPLLLDLLNHLQHHTGSQGTFHVISGYRSPATNAMLRRLTQGVAKHSLHMQGKAIDIRLPGCELSHLHRLALDMRAGGVGFYPASNFIHVDTGPVRSW